MNRFLSLFFCLLSFELLAQKPSNDDCQNAETINISNSGFGTGTFSSLKHNVYQASIQSGETCSPDLVDNGNCSKTIWFKFFVPTNRDISIQLKQQDSAIPQIFGGINVFSIKNCAYGVSDLTRQLVPIAKFGLSGNTCLASGWYYIQAGFNQRANGEVWIDLVSQKAASQAYDSHLTPLDFGTVNNTSVSKTLFPDCSSMEKQEWQSMSNDSFTRSVYARFVIPANSLKLKVAMRTFSGRVRYRIFKDTMTIDSISSNKPFIEFNKMTEEIAIFKYCTSSGLKKYFVQFITEYGTVDQIWMSVSNSIFTTDLWSTPSTNDVINTFNGFSRSKIHEFNCNGNLKLHGCKSVVPEKIPYEWNYGWYSYKDTFVYAGYTIINSTESGVLKVVSTYNNIYPSGMYYLLYKGDITQNCNLVNVYSKLADTLAYCISSGTYTLVTVCYPQFSLSFNHKIWQESPVLNQVNYYPKWPENLGTITNGMGSLLGNTIHINDLKDTTIVVDTLSVKGYMIFREFRVGTKMAIDVYDDIPIKYKVLSYYIFKGRFSKGDVKLMDNFSYVKMHYFFGWNACQVYDTGYYSILCVYDSRNAKLSCDPPVSKIVISPTNVCTTNTFYFPINAYKVNGHSDVLTASGNYKNLDYVFELPHCMMCNTTTAKPALTVDKKQYVDNLTGFSFYTFYLGTNAEFRTNQDESSFELYKGDCALDPNLINDTMNVVSRCAGGYTYCNLEGGKYYTFVDWGVPYSNFVKLYFTPHVKSPNNYAKSAYDIGHFNQNKTVTSTPLPITCHTTGYDIDPCAMDMGQIYCSYKYYGNITIPYPDTLNVKRSYKRRNIWYTFTVDGSADVSVSLYGQTTLDFTKLFSVYRYTGPYQSNASLALGNGFDSTSSHMQLLVSNDRTNGPKGESRVNTVSFTNISCSSNRYFVLVEDDWVDKDKARYNYLVTVDAKINILPTQGDFCSTAVTGSISGFGKTIVKANNVCHTYGNSPNELDTASWVKSSWFKVSITGLKKFDLKVKKLNGDGVLYYNVYGGTCGNLIKILRPDEGRAYFVLSCMGGSFDDYYIQAISNKVINEEVSFEIETLIASNAGCKPFDFMPPEASIEVKGLCGSDSIRFFSSGKNKGDKVYKWYLNHQLFSYLKHPVMAINSPELKDSNDVRLVIVDTISLLSDTADILLKPKRKAYKFEILGPDSVLCKQSFTLKLDTDFNGTINCVWTGIQDPGPYTGNELKINNLTSNRTYFLKGTSGECLFYDTFTVHFNPVSNLFRDSSMCPDGRPIRINRKNLQTFSINGSSIQTDSFDVSGPGKYLLKYKYNGCDAEEILWVKADTTIKITYLSDTFTICNLQSIELKNPRPGATNVLWSNGANTDKINVNTASKYLMKADLSACEKLEYTVRVGKEVYPVNVLKDTTICFGESLLLANPLPQFEVVLSMPPLGLQKINSNTTRIIHLKKGNCDLKDTVNVFVVNTDNFQKDTFICDLDAAISVDLDAGSALKYNWAPISSFNRILNVKDYGTYYVYKTQKFNCMDTGVFKVRMNCPINVFIPNVFTPDANLLNDLFQPSIYGQEGPYEMQIYNRWGELLYETTSGIGWSGLYNGQPVQQDVYVYIVRVADVFGKSYYFRGTFTVLR